MNRLQKLPFIKKITFQRIYSAMKPAAEVMPEELEQLQLYGLDQL